LVVTVEKEFSRIFKMLVEKGAALMLSNEESILHVIMKRKFKKNSNKKRFLKELANRWQLSQVKDKSGKLPIEYETDNDVKNYYLDLFKPKIRNVPEKDHHKKEREILSPHHLSKEKELKKKLREEEQQIVPEEEGV
jgi:pyruvate carboxylase